MQIGEKGIENMLVNMVYLERGKKLILKGMYSKEKKTLFVYLFTWECAKKCLIEIFQVTTTTYKTYSCST